MLPGSTHDLTAARELVLPGARPCLKDLPILADSGYEGVGAGVHVPVRTERLAQALAAVVPCVIGMRQPVGDRSAIRFSIGFYQALAAGKPVETAFDAGVAQLMMTPEGDDALAPLLLHGLEGA